MAGKAPPGGAPVGAGAPQLTPNLKPLNKYLQQAKKLEKIDPTVSYYCRMYAAQMGVQIKNKDKSDMGYMKYLMDILEKQKKTLPPLQTDARTHVETFALNVFNHADSEDRAGKASMKTVLSFHAAFVFMEICKQFGELASDIEEKLKYAAWKAADISKALKEGRTPTPGGVNDNVGDVKVDDENGGDDAPGAGSGSTTPGAQGGSGGVGKSDSTRSLPHAPEPGAPAHTPTPYNPYSYGNGAPAHSNGADDNITPPPHGDAHMPQQDALPAELGLPGDNAPPAHTPTPAHTPAPSGYGGYAPRYGSTAPSAPSAPPPSASHTPAVPVAKPVAAHAPAAAHSSATPAVLTNNSVTVYADTRLDQMNAVIESEKLLKHAIAALRFRDAKGAILKMSEAIAILLPHQDYQ